MYREHLLFVCSRNQWRSPTAAALFADSDRYVAKSAGTSDSARIKITPGLINLADCCQPEAAHKTLFSYFF
jgi:predicted protein tyrosine phosphatase